MKKFVSIIVALVLVMCMTTASAAVVSKTTTDTINFVEIKAVNEEVVLPNNFQIKVTGDAKEVKAEIASLYAFVNEAKQAPFNYFPEATRQTIVDMLGSNLEEGVLLEEVVTLEEMEINEFATVMVIGYDEAYGDIEATIDFVTDYMPTQKALVLFGLYNGDKVDEKVKEEAQDIQGEYVVEWVVLDVEVLEDSNVVLTIPQDVMLKLMDAKSIGMTVLSDKMVEDVVVVAE